MDPSKCPTQFKVTAPKNGCMRDLCKGLSALSDVDSSQMIVTDVYNHKFHKIYKPEDGLHNILDRDDIFVYVYFHVEYATKKDFVTLRPHNLTYQIVGDQKLLWNQFLIEILCVCVWWIKFPWHNPCERRVHSASKNIGHTNCRN